MSASTKFYFKPGENELIQTVVHIKPDARSAIQGYVRDMDDRAIPDALIMLFESGTDDLKLVTQTFTDDAGMFFFGPLNSGRLHLIKVFKDTVKIRELEIRPEQGRE